ncbi:NAD(+) diphosphatase [Methylovirgula sp. 4M-Z18]|uniref:NAD(+) diphosphatase n=1 Tax=Methylovirgula sp. 4M-Z18 TaxID=2293567 RepID=UPI000E2E67AF|nr:NAD(+) diphosphatase [Methylovirgula sp. 4M-Z18]RFB79533.1 NAD(+) diphosphatase [Methylovirgula sp. 4M-Z18]
MTQSSFLDRSGLTGFAASSLNRLSEKRDDAAYLAALRREPGARSVVLAGDIPVLKDLNALFSLAEAESLGPVQHSALLGHDGIHPVFATLLDASAIETKETADDGAMLETRVISLRGRPDLNLQDLRSLAIQGLLPANVLGILGHAKSLMHWHMRHGFCPNCGAPTRIAAAGWRRECDACNAHHFPRVDPVAIMLAVDGDRCLMGRQARFAPKMYSCLAGFIEPGETMEDAVRRELHEEAGIETGRVHYLAAQPWPFPSSLMIGCIAEAKTTELTVDTTELEHARWFDREECRSILRRDHPDGLICPPKMAIAHHLLRAWVEGDTGAQF